SRSTQADSRAQAWRSTFLRPAARHPSSTDPASGACDEYSHTEEFMNVKQLMPWFLLLSLATELVAQTGPPTPGGPPVVSPRPRAQAAPRTAATNTAPARLPVVPVPPATPTSALPPVAGALAPS